MAKSYIHTVVKGQKIKLSNLDKILYPKSNVTKAEVIQYYLDIAPLILKYIRMRPLTLIRFPDGIDNEKFYAKSKPKWTPDWVKSYNIKHSQDSISYLITDEEPSVVWLANIAALEIHPMQMTIDKIDHPDHFIFDLDPPENGDFENVKDVALLLRTFLESRGYNAFVKTSGSKGLHIFIPIHKLYSHEEMVTAVKLLAKSFVLQNKDTCTLSLSKNKRDGKILIDILRNHESHTTVAPYSLRGKYGAPISFPITWDKVPRLTSSKEITIRNYKSHLDKDGDTWKDFYNSATHLHTDTQNPKGLSEEVQSKLKLYNEKRNFDLSPEPQASVVSNFSNRYCIQLHDASNLHYDLRLEHEGTLLSWAIPKGLPSELKIKRLAIRTEDHPLSYLTFEGTIPKGEYGAGKMWVFDFGKIIWSKKSKTKYEFILKNKSFERKYSLVKTKGEQWLIQLLSKTDSKIELPIKPMLANQAKKLPTGKDVVYEIKWDGIRCIIHLENEKIKIYSRSGRDITSKFPELCNVDFFDVESGIFDGEIVSLDEKGRPLFSKVISRMHLGDSKTIRQSQSTNNIVCYLFDCLQLDGKSIVSETLTRRQAWLKCAIKRNKTIRLSEALKDGKALLEATRKMDLEGIIAKKTNGKYSIGQRTEAWVKIKHRSEADCFIAGYTKGEGDRSALFGSLHLLKKDNGNFKYMGKVGTGFDGTKMMSILELLEPLIIEDKPFDEKTSDDKDSIWVKPMVQCKIQYASLASTGTFREPVFIELINN